MQMFIKILIMEFTGADLLRHKKPIGQPSPDYLSAWKILNQDYVKIVTCLERLSQSQTGGCLRRLYVLMQYISHTSKQTSTELLITRSFLDMSVIFFNSQEFLRLSILNISNSTTIIVTTKLIPPELFQKDRK